MSAPERILQVIGSLNNGGSQAMILNLYRSIDRTKVQFDFIVDHPKEMYLADEVKSLGGRIYFLPTFTGFNIKEVCAAWETFFNSHPEYRIIHTHVRSYAAIYLGIAKKHGLVTISHSHSTSSGEGFKAAVKNVLQIRLRYVSDYMFSCSEQAGVWLYGKKAAASPRHFVLNNAIDTKKYIYSHDKAKAERSVLGIPEDSLVLGHVGRFIKVKNQSFVIEVFSKVHELYSDSYLLLVGDGEMLKEAKEKVKSLSLEKYVIFTGQSRKVPELMMATDVLVFPSLFEGLPVTLVEAQASGLPCVISDTVDAKSDMTGLITRLSLSEPCFSWANAVIEAKTDHRRDTSKEISDGGYDITTTAKWLSDFYLAKSGRKQQAKPEKQAANQRRF